MKEIKAMTVDEMMETLDYFYMSDCPIKQYVDSSFIPTMIDRLRDEFNIFYHPRIRFYYTNESLSDNERLKNRTNILASTVATLQEKIRSLEESENSKQKRIDELITKCNELIEENKNLKKLYKCSIEKQYRLETDNAELLRKVKIQDDSEKVISKLKKKQEETERLLHESVAKVNEECQSCVNAERKQIKENILKHIAHEYPITYFNYKYKLWTYSIEDIVKLIMRVI